MEPFLFVFEYNNMLLKIKVKLWHIHQTKIRKLMFNIYKILHRLIEKVNLQWLL